MPKTGSKFLLISKIPITIYPTNKAKEIDEAIMYFLILDRM